MPLEVRIDPELRIIFVEGNGIVTDADLLLYVREYLDGESAYAPKYWPKEFVHYANSYGKHKVLFGTDWPVIDPERAVQEIDDLGFRDDAKQMLMRDNALRVFNLPA